MSSMVSGSNFAKNEPKTSNKESMSIMSTKNANNHYLNKEMSTQWKIFIKSRFESIENGGSEH